MQVQVQVRQSGVVVTDVMQVQVQVESLMMLLS